MSVSQEQAGWFSQAFQQMVGNIDQVVLGKQHVVRLALTCLLSEGHLLLEDYPGTGKTQLARAVAGTVQGSSSRIQFTPDLLPSDVTGTTIFDPNTNRFFFRPGPIFAHIVLADEINRTPPKTQSALLEAMEERQVTADGTSHQLADPFLVVATQNPVLRERYSGKAEYVVNFMRFVAEEVREYLAELGFRSLDEAIGHTECLDKSRAFAHNKRAAKLDLEPIFAQAESPFMHQDLRRTKSQDHKLDGVVDRTLIEDARAVIADAATGPFTGSYPI